MIHAKNAFTLICLFLRNMCEDDAKYKKGLTKTVIIATLSFGSYVNLEKLGRI